MLLRTDMGSTTCKDEQMIAIMGMKMPENCASCPCLYTDFEGWHCDQRTDRCFQAGSDPGQCEGIGEYILHRRGTWKN